MASIVKKSIPKELLDLMSAGVASNHRSILIVLGPHGVERIPTIYTLLQKKTSQNPKVLWCYHKELDISSNKEKRLKQLNQKRANGTLNEDLATSIDLFFRSPQVKYAKYSDSHRALGQTFNMLVLQDFASITPNILARTVETVSGGGLVVLLLNTMQSLEDLYSTSMDYQKGMSRTAFGNVSSRFNSRFFKSIKECRNCIAITDEFDLLNSVTSTFVPDTTRVDGGELDDFKEEYSKIVQDLTDRIAAADDAKIQKRLEHEKKEREKIAAIVEKSVTSDQAKTVSKVIEAIKDKQLGKVIGITAARGRGKSAAIGLSLAAALAIGYSNLFVTAPSVANLTALFEFVVIGLNTLGYREGENEDYHIDKSRPKSSKEQSYVTAINVHFQHGRKQVVQYIHPTMKEYLGQCEILAIDEAAAIPLPIVRALMGPYTTLFSSTVDGYEGTGRALSLKLFKEFKTTMKGRFSEISLKKPIRYSDCDPIEEWLHNLLLLEIHPQECEEMPDPQKCELYFINRSALFSGRKVSEELLRALISLSVESHYKNTPNDLTLMADSPNHRIFALMNPSTISSKGIPQILVFIQVALEGSITAEQYSRAENGQGRRDGDLIPWNIARAFEEPEFTELTGVRIVRIAVHPDIQRKGYGKAAVDKLISFYSPQEFTSEERAKLQTCNSIEEKKNILLSPLPTILPEPITYMGVSFGLTRDLAHFWKKSGFNPVYISRETNEVTGEHSMIVIRPMKEVEWLPRYSAEFHTTTYRLLPTLFKNMMPFVIEELLFPLSEPVADSDGKTFLTDSDIRKLSRWSGDGIGQIKPILEPITDFIFQNRPPIQITKSELFVFIIMGKQMQDEEEAAKRLTLQINQIVALLKSAIGKISRYIRKQRGDPSASKKEKIVDSPNIE